MKPLQDLLTDGDPLAYEPALGDIQARAIRRAVVTAADEAPAPQPWRQAVMVTAMAALMLAAVATVARREPPRADSAQTLAELPPAEVQFSTPGGTRVIWVFDQSGQW